MVHTSFMKAAISLLNPNNIKHFGLGSIGGKQSPLVRETEHIEYESSPSEWAILLTTQKFVPSTFSTPRLIKKTTSIITTFHNSESKDQAWKQKNHSLGSKEVPILHSIYLFLCLLAFALWIMLFVLGRTTTYIFNEDPHLDINEHALHGLGVVFSKGNRAMENLIIANLEEGCNLIDFRLFLRTLYRSGAMARADLVLLFPWSTTIPEHVLGIISEEGRSFRRLRSLMDSTQTLDSAPCISIFNRTAFETPKDPRGESEASRKWSDALWGKCQVPSSTHGDEHKGPSSIECGRGDDVASMQHGDDHKRPSMKCGNGDINPKHGGEERRSIIWGHGGVASSTNGDKRSWADLLGVSAHERKRSSSSSSSISEETGNEFNFGSVVGFQINELDSTDGFSGFLMDPSSRLRRWLCYQMLLGLLKHKFEQVMLVELGGVVVLGDVFMHPKHGDFLHFTAQDSTWEEAILQKPTGDSEKVHRAALVQGKHARDVMIKKTLYNNEVKDKEKNGIKEKGACDFNETETPKKAKNPSMVKEEKETMFERLYGKELWKSLDRWEKKRRVMSSGVILGSMRATKGLVNAMVVEVVRVAMKKEKTNMEFPDEVLLSYLVQKSPHLLGKKVTENLQILSNKESMAHCLDGSKQEHVFQRTMDGQRYSVLQHASSLNISQFQGSRLDIAQLIMYDICASSIDMSLIYEDCIHYR